MIILFFNADLQSVSRKTFQKTNLHDVLQCTANSMNFPGLRLLIEGKESFNAEMRCLKDTVKEIWKPCLIYIVLKAV